MISWKTDIEVWNLSCWLTFLFVPYRHKIGDIIIAGWRSCHRFLWIIYKTYVTLILSGDKSSHRVTQAGVKVVVAVYSTFNLGTNTLYLDIMAVHRFQCRRKIPLTKFAINLTGVVYHTRKQQQILYIFYHSSHFVHHCDDMSDRQIVVSPV